MSTANVVTTPGANVLTTGGATQGIETYDGWVRAFCNGRRAKMQFMMAWLVGVLEILVPGRSNPKETIPVPQKRDRSVEV